MSQNDQQLRLQALDGLRAVSILLVVFSHVWLGHIVPGGLGVTIFFFISGFIITRLMLTEWEESGTVDIRHFYIRRFFRLIPTLLVFVLLSVAAMYAAGQAPRLEELLSVFFYFANYYGIFVGFSGDTLPPPLAITWSLAVEEHFYMVFPFLFLALASSTRRFLYVIAGLLLVVLLWRLYLVCNFGLEHLVQYRTYKATDTRFDSIMYGTGYSILLYRCKWAKDIFARWTVFLAGVVLMLVSLLVRNEEFRETVRYSLQGLALACLFYRMIFSDNVLKKILSSAPMLYIGKISYSLYLYHWLAYGLVVAWLPDEALFTRIFVVLGLSFLSAHLSYRYVEQIFLRIGRKFAH